MPKFVDSSEVHKYRSKKDTKTWCRGKKGVPHSPRWRRYDELTHASSVLKGRASWLVFVCDKCGREIDTYFTLFGQHVQDPPVEGSRKPRAH